MHSRNSSLDSIPRPVTDQWLADSEQASLSPSTSMMDMGDIQLTLEKNLLKSLPIELLERQELEVLEQLIYQSWAMHAALQLLIINR